MNKFLKILLVVIVCVLIVNLIIFLSNKNDMQYAVYGAREDAVSAEGYIIKNEILMKSDGDKRFYYSDGERVSKGARIATYVGAGTDDALLTELAAVEEQIKLLREGGVTNASSDPALLGEQIKEKTRELTYYVSQKNFAAADRVKNEILLLRSKTADEQSEDQDVLDTLYAKKSQLESQIGSSGASVYAPAAGILFLQSDGFENVLKPDTISELTVNKLLNIENEKQQITEGDCKITDNFIFYIGTVMEADKTEELTEGKTVRLRFAGFSSESVKADVHYVSDEEDGKKVVVFSCNKMAEELLSSREVSFDIIKSSYEGFILPASALAEEEGVEGVYVQNGVNFDFRKVCVIYRDDETIIVSKLPSAENELLIYDNVILNP